MVARMEERSPAGALLSAAEGGWKPDAALQALGYAGE
jgi:hypothetical protein